MGLLNRTFVRRHEIGLVFQRGELVRVLEPGTHWLPGLFAGLRQTRVQVVSTLQTYFKHPSLELLIEDARLRAKLHVLQLAENERVIVWRDGVIGLVLGPGLHALWREPREVLIEHFDTQDFELQHPQLTVLLGSQRVIDQVRVVQPANQYEALVFRDNELVQRVAKGRFVYWRDSSNVIVHQVDMRERTLDVGGQEIMTRDKVTLRVNLVLTYRVTDPVLAITGVTDYEQALYRAAQLALRAAIGMRTLDALLANKESTSDELLAVLAAQATGYGLAVAAVGLRDIVLPGEMKTILNQVIEAQKAAEANTVRRREETAAARSQANTAKLLAENPILARLKELELLQEVLAGTKATFVFGQGDVLGQVQSLVGADESANGKD